jgi:hypothetical protein
MRSNMSKKWMLVPVLALAAACSKGDEARVDDALKNDLALAGSQGYQPQQFVSPMEQGYMPQPGYAPYPYGPQAYQPQPYYAGAYGPPAQVYQQQPVVYRSAPATTTRRRSSSGTAARSSGTYSRVPSGTVTKRNTKRDAVIGAVAGTAIGVATSRDKVKGGIIGAAAGGLLGAVIGHTVDVQRAP